jgi:hypothetical protein
MKHIRDAIEETMDIQFREYAKDYGLKTGDISPEDKCLFDKSLDNISEVFSRWLFANWLPTLKDETRVEFIEDYDIFPTTIIKKGAKGIIHEIAEDCVYVLLDVKNPDLDAWDNIVQLTPDGRMPFEYIQKIDGGK